MKNPSDGMRTASRNACEACGRRGGRGKRAIARRRRPVSRRLHAGFNLDFAGCRKLTHVVMLRTGTKRPRDGSSKRDRGVRRP